MTTESDRFDSFNDKELYVLHAILGRIAGASPPRSLCDRLHDQTSQVIAQRRGVPRLEYSQWVKIVASAGYALDGTLEFKTPPESFEEFAF